MANGSPKEGSGPLKSALSWVPIVSALALLGAALLVYNSLEERIKKANETLTKDEAKELILETDLKNAQTNIDKVKSGIAALKPEEVRQAEELLQKVQQALKAYPDAEKAVRAFGGIGLFTCHVSKLGHAEKEYYVGPSQYKVSISKFTDHLGHYQIALVPTNDDRQALAWQPVVVVTPDDDKLYSSVTPPTSDSHVCEARFFSGPDWTDTGFNVVVVFGKLP